MRRSWFLVFLFVLSVNVYSQTAINLLNQLPALPSNYCEKDQETRDKYLGEVRKVLDQLDELIYKKKKAQNEYIKNSKREIEQKMIEESGLSSSEVQKLKNKKMSKEEKKAIAEKMMMEKTGISMSEIDQLKKMSKEGKKNWAEAYATQQQANLAGGGQDNEKTPEQTALEKNMKKSGDAAKLAKEQSTIMTRIEASDKKFARRLIEVIKKDSVERIQLNQTLRPYFAKLNALPGPSEEEAKSICETIKSLQYAYCAKITPQYAIAFKDAEISLKANIGDYKRLAEINAELNKATVGNSLQSMDSEDLMELQAVKSFASQLLNVYKYAVYGCSGGSQ